ncbi:MAG: phosphoprotein [Bat tupavirus BS2]|nr:MAG: phosphoprotein [Bat tupavirus BS2]
MSRQKVSSSILAGYDLKEVENSLGECEEGLGVNVGGLQIGGSGEDQEATRVEAPRSREGCLDSSPFSRSDHHVQIIPVGEDTSDDEEEPPDVGSEGISSGHSPDDDARGRGSLQREGRGESRYFNPKSSLPDVPKEARGYVDLYEDDQTSTGFTEGQIRGFSDLQEKEGAGARRWLDDIGREKVPSNSERITTTNLEEREDPDSSDISKANRGGQETTSSGGIRNDVSANNRSYKIPFSLDKHLNSPIWTRHAEIIQLIEELARVGNLHPIIEEDHILLEKRESATGSGSREDRPPPKEFSITWGDYTKQLIEGFKFKSKKDQGVVIINANSFNLGDIQEGQIKVDSGDTELDILIKCLRLKGLYNYLAKKVHFA